MHLKLHFYTSYRRELKCMLLIGHLTLGFSNFDVEICASDWLSAISLSHSLSLEMFGYNPPATASLLIGSFHLVVNHIKAVLFHLHHSQFTAAKKMTSRTSVKPSLLLGGFPAFISVFTRGLPVGDENRCNTATELLSHILSICKYTKSNWHE